MKAKNFTLSKTDFENEFNKQKPFYEDLENEAKHTLKKQLDKSGVKIHSIMSRIKSIESCLGKVERFQIENPFESIQDFVGIRIICLLLSDIPKIGEIIRNNFDVIKYDGKIESNQKSDFRYLSDHYIVKFADTVSGVRYDDIKSLSFEIQVRTIAMDAWANISHYLDYKTDQDIPEELKRDFYALSGMFYVADKHFQLFFEQRHRKQDEIDKAFEKEDSKDKLELPINLDTLTAYLREKFPDRQHGEIGSISRVVKSLKEADYREISEIDEIISKNLSIFLQYEKDLEIVPKRCDIDVVRETLQICDDNFLRVMMKNLSKSEELFEQLYKRGQQALSPYRELIRANPVQSK